MAWNKLHLLCGCIGESIDGELCRVKKCGDGEMYDVDRHWCRWDEVQSAYALAKLDRLKKDMERIRKCAVPAC